MRGQDTTVIVHTRHFSERKAGQGWESAVQLP